MVVDLVDNWNGDGSVYVPSLNRSYCESLRAASTVVNELYGSMEGEDD
jgi:hypothetical protein